MVRVLWLVEMMTPRMQGTLNGYASKLYSIHPFILCSEEVLRRWLRHDHHFNLKFLRHIRTVFPTWRSLPLVEDVRIISSTYQIVSSFFSSEWFGAKSALWLGLGNVDAAETNREKASLNFRGRDLTLFQALILKNGTKQSLDGGHGARGVVSVFPASFT